MVRVCSLCNKKYPENIHTCELSHCGLCGFTNLTIKKWNPIRDPISILIHTVFFILSIPAITIDSPDTIIAIVMLLMIYSIIFYFYCLNIDRRPFHFCLSCNTQPKKII